MCIQKVHSSWVHSYLNLLVRKPRNICLQTNENKFPVRSGWCERTRGGSQGDWGCKAAITQNTFGGHYRASHAEWLLQAETLLTVFKVDLMKAFIQSSSLVWALDSTRSEITHCGPALGGQCQEFLLFICFCINHSIKKQSRTTNMSGKQSTCPQRQSSVWEIMHWHN